ncbi:hypothetical protein D3C87_1122200 [compost metagenome]
MADSTRITNSPATLGFSPKSVAILFNSAPVNDLLKTSSPTSTRFAFAQASLPLISVGKSICIA